MATASLSPDVSITRKVKSFGRIPVEQLVGLKFGRMTVTGVAPRVGVNRMVYCVCECGVTKVVNKSRLVSGATSSCGCKRRDTLAAIGKSRPNYEKTMPAEYRAWHSMKTRCISESCESYKHYGGRGITVCERWLHSFQNFLDDLGPRPSNKHSLDRIDNNGNYEPGNVRWATWTEQQRNRRNNRRIEHNGITMTAIEWAQRKGISHATFTWRLAAGWSDEEAIELPVNPKSDSTWHR